MADGGGPRTSGEALSAQTASAAAPTAQWVSGELVDDVVDARRQRLKVCQVDRRVHSHPQLVPAQLAVRLDVDDAVAAEHRRDLACVHPGLEVDRAHDVRAVLRSGHERRGVRPVSYPHLTLPTNREEKI